MNELGTRFPGIRGCVKLALRNAKTGEVAWRTENHNAPATLGMQWLWLHALSGIGASSQVIGFLAVGTDTTAPATGDTALGSEVERKAIDSFDTSNMTVSTGPNFEMQVEYATDEANGTLAECGAFNSSAAGTMLAHATFNSTEKTTDYILGLSYSITQAVT